jgi:ectoine hydroxylase-related dioxygenase (phytanoyl-CoA dioxygenase family)
MTTAAMARPATVSPEQIEQFHQEGYLVVRGMFSPEEARELRDRFMEIHARAPIGEFYRHASAEEAGGDPLKLYPRVMHPHRFDELSMRRMLDPRIFAVLWDLFGEEPLAAQSMFYFKPPGAKGQALHQDNFYLRVKPGTCIAAWVAVDPAVRENGGLVVVPGSNRGEVFCPERADSSVSFTTEYVKPPAGLSETPVDLQPGDTLFFNGSLIHGSAPNTSRDQFRRSFICHYVPTSAREMSHWYFPLHDMEGNRVEREATAWGGPCGTEADGPH